MRVAQKTVILDYREEQGLGHIQMVYWDGCVALREMNVYTHWLVGGIVIILMFMCKNRNELGKYPV